MIFAWEKLGTLLADGVEEILFQNFEEIEIDQDRIPLAPDWDYYFSLERMGVYRIVSARTDGKLAGYASFFVRKHRRHMNTLFAISDEIYLLPEYRKGWTGVAFIRESERLLKELGVVKIEMGEKEHVKLGSSGGTLGDLLEKLGYRHTESVFTKTLG